LKRALRRLEKRNDRPFDRFILIVLDGVGIGAQDDSGEYGDADADSLGHVAEEIGLKLPNLSTLGIGEVKPGYGFRPDDEVGGFYGRLTMAAAGKDSTSGHWELAGLRLNEPFPVFPNGFPDALIKGFEAATGRNVLGNKPASGTEIIEELGLEHIATGALIVYTSADSVFQIAAHTDVVPEEELYGYCETARSLLVGDLAVGRVIARPFDGEPGRFRRTLGRKDYSLPPPGPTVLDLLAGAGYEVRTVGKIDYLFAGSGVTKAVHTSGDADGIERIIEQIREGFCGVLFANLNDTDTVYGHRNDPTGYAAALEAFDVALPDIESEMKPGDALLITSDHGNDPTTPGTDHTRERTPLLGWYPGWSGARDLGTRGSLADVGSTIARALLVEASLDGESFLDEIIN
jgi:phosphopentomutase